MQGSVCLTNMMRLTGQAQVAMQDTEHKIHNISAVSQEAAWQTLTHLRAHGVRCLGLCRQTKGMCRHSVLALEACKTLQAARGPRNRIMITACARQECSACIGALLAPGTFVICVDSPAASAHGLGRYFERLWTLSILRGVSDSIWDLPGRPSSGAAVLQP
jgi:hypothetical protein